MGLPGSGKSTVTRELGRLLSYHTLHEPQPQEWPAAVLKRKKYGHFTALAWFRSVRLPQLMDAASIRASGESVVVDTYFDKLQHLWLGRRGMDWLIPPSDRYYPIAAQLCELDYRQLPAADVLIFFRVTKVDWLEFLAKRAWPLDTHPELLASFATQRLLLAASRRWCRESGCEFHEVVQRSCSPEEIAAELTPKLRSRTGE